ncbi:Hypothetical predicted protein [Pelobates cultripes]|uniref:Uncharacterized protein n=1 Tax=Pelobates cultripes TaxID=61616 RepID=A0AAD1WIE9_PELCU|nr:Hypothetical predicted protein [Pelobates cultripes]
MEFEGTSITFFNDILFPALLERRKLAPVAKKLRDLLVTNGDISADDPEMLLRSLDKEETPPRASTSSRTGEEKQRTTVEGKPWSLPKIRELGIRKM